MSDSEEVKKRALDQEEIEIDLEQHAPLSKKQKRLLRKGKLDLEKLQAKEKAEAQAAQQKKEDAEDDKEAKGEAKVEEKPKYGVWIGNLSFDTSKDDLIRFITNKTTDHKDYSEGLAEDEPAQVNEEDITRVNLPTGKDKKKIKGFAYIDFAAKQHQLAVIQLSEQNLNGRNLLIKDSKSFDGRPAKEEAALSKNPPSRILFVGNLSYDTTEDQLTQHFQHCGEIMRVRMATFEDSGKCKGFAFLDFRDEEGPTKALKDKSCRKLINRPLRMEFGEDRSKRTPKQKSNLRTNTREEKQDYEVPEIKEHYEPVSKPIRERSTAPKKPLKKRDEFVEKNSRTKSSVALANAQRASSAIVKSTGKKITF